MFPLLAILVGVLVLVWLFDRRLEGDDRRRTRWSYGLLLFALLWLHYYLAVYVLLLAGLALVDRVQVSVNTCEENENLFGN